MKLQVKVVDPLDWGARKHPFLHVQMQEPLARFKTKHDYGWKIDSSGPFYDIFMPNILSNDRVGLFNCLPAEAHTPRLIDVQLSIKSASAITMAMDLKRARYELKKALKEDPRNQTWSIRLDTLFAENTGKVIYRPQRLRGATCGAWLASDAANGGYRCTEHPTQVIVTRSGVTVPLCGKHLYDEKSEHIIRRQSA